MGLTIAAYDYNGVVTLNNIYATVRNIRSTKLDPPYPVPDVDKFTVMFTIELWVDNTKTKKIGTYGLNSSVPPPYEINIRGSTVVADVWALAYTKAKETLEAAGLTVIDVM